MKTKIVLLGAGGKMGCRITDNIRHVEGFEVSYLENSKDGLARMSERGVHAAEPDSVLPGADAVVLAVPDALIGKITHQISGHLKTGAIVIGLDPAAAHAGAFPKGDGVAYFVCHPCHPPLFGDETDPEALTDWFGGRRARQSIVCALERGTERDYELGQRIAREMFKPILRVHRLTVEQMALLEPGVVETTCLTLLMSIKEAMDEAIRMGVPEQAARDFVLGHIRVELAIVFGFAGFPVSDGARLAAEEGGKLLLRDNWKDVLKPENIHASVQRIAQSRKGP